MIIPTFLSSALGSAVSNAAKNVKDVRFQAVSSGLFYPAEIKDQKDRPLIQFRIANPRGIDQLMPLYFPIPTGLDFSDAASYDDAELGTLGKFGLDAGKGAAGAGGDFMDMAKGAMNGLKSSIQGVGVGDLVARIAGSGGSMVMPDNIKSAISIGMGSTLNKNIMTEFTGVGTRNFSFKFKMYASSPSDSQTIKSIVHTFRLGSYPEGNTLALKYPPRWVIRFVNSSTLTDLTHIPKITECYLQSVNTQFNETAAVWHADGSPVDCTITLTFKEVRALTAADIIKMDGNKWEKLGEVNSAKNTTTELETKLKESTEIKKVDTIQPGTPSRTDLLRAQSARESTEIKKVDTIQPGTPSRTDLLRAQSARAST